MIAPCAWTRNTAPDSDHTPDDLPWSCAYPPARPARRLPSLTPPTPHSSTRLMRTFTISNTNRPCKSSAAPSPRTPAPPTSTITWAQTLVFREMFRNGALESELVSGNNSFLRRPKLNPTPEIEKELLGEVAQSMALAEARLKRNPNDTAAMYALGIAYGPARQLLLDREEVVARFAARRHPGAQTAQPHHRARAQQHRRAPGAGPARLHRGAACRWSTRC